MGKRRRWLGLFLGSRVGDDENVSGDNFGDDGLVE